MPNLTWMDGVSISSVLAALSGFLPVLLTFIATTLAIIWYGMMITDWLQVRREKRAARLAAEVVAKAAAVAAEVRAETARTTEKALTTAARVVETAAVTADLVVKAAAIVTNTVSEADLQAARVKAWADELECDLSAEDRGLT